MPNNSGTSDEKKARLEAIRAANAAKKAQGGTEEVAPVTVAAVQAPAPAAVTTAAVPASAGANMSDDKKAKLEAIRAANAAKKADSGVAPVAGITPAVAPAAARPAAVAPAAAAPAARPAAARPTPKSTILEDDRIPMPIYLRRAVIGAVLGLILCLMLATMTGNYITGAVWGVILGALAGILIFNWPPERTTGD